MSKTLKWIFGNKKLVFGSFLDNKGIALTTAIIAGSALAVGGAAYSARKVEKGARRAATTQAEAEGRAIEAQETAETRAVKRREEAARAAKLKKEAAYGEAKGILTAEAGRTIPTLGELPTAQKLRGTLEERLAGRGVGFDPAVMDAATAPYAEARREGFKKYEVPAISAAASARGLGRSTVPVSQISLRAQEAERDIETRVADITVKNEEQKRMEINTALEQYKQFTGAALASRQEKEKFERMGQYELANLVSKQGSDMANIELVTGDALANLEFQSGANLAGIIERGGEAQATLGYDKGVQEAANMLKMAEIVGSMALGFTMAKTYADTQTVSKTTDDILREAISEQMISGGMGPTVLRYEGSGHRGIFR